MKRINSLIFIGLISIILLTSFSNCISLNYDNIKNKDIQKDIQNNGYTTTDENYQNIDWNTFIHNHKYIYGKVVKVVDGDTIYIVDDKGNKYKIRLLGVDTPETYVKNNPGEYKLLNGMYISNITYLKLWGKKATEFAKSELDNKMVYAVFDKYAPEKGKYGRYLCYIIVDGEDFNEELLRYGYARVYVSNFELKDRFLKEEYWAKKNRIGLWNYTINN